MRSRIDQRDTARHVGQNLFVKDDFALDAACSFRLASVEFSEEPRCNCRSGNQPGDGNSKFADKILHWAVRLFPGLLYDRRPARRIDRAERIEIPIALHVSACAFTNFRDQTVVCGRVQDRIGAEVLREQSRAILVEHLAGRLLAYSDRRQAPPDPFDQNRNARRNRLPCDRACGPRRRYPIQAGYRTRGDAPVRYTRRSREGAVTPQVGIKILSHEIRNRRNRSDKTAFGVSDEHTVDARMREIGLIDPTLTGIARIWIRQVVRDRGKRLVGTR